MTRILVDSERFLILRLSAVVALGFLMSCQSAPEPSLPQPSAAQPEAASDALSPSETKPENSAPQADETSEKHESSSAVECRGKSRDTARARKVLKAIEEAGVRSLPIFEHSAGAPLGDEDSFVRYWLCLAEHESNFGKRTVGRGGRGLFGVSKRHVKRKVRALLPETGKSFRCQGDIRRNWNDNISCAFALYLRNQGFRDWGSPNGRWGVNRKCGAETVACYPSSAD